MCESVPCTNSRDMPLCCIILCQPMRQLDSLSKLSTAQLRAHPHLGIQDLYSQLPAQYNVFISLYYSYENGDRKVHHLQS